MRPQPPPTTSVPVTLGSPRFTSREVRGFLVTEAHFPPDAILPMHTHERPTIALMLEGSFECVLPGKVLPCEPGALHTEPAEARHGNRIGRRGARVIVIQPDALAVARLEGHTSLVDAVHYLAQTPVTMVGWQLAREMHRDDGAAALATEGLVLEFLASALRGASPEPEPGAMPRWLRRAQEYLHAHFTESIRIGELARALDVNAVRLARSFRRHFGISIGDYVRRLRLEWASIELASTLEPLAGIAVRAGFADQSHFTRAFRRHTGTTPSSYRRTAGR